jgi:hypothetical protein
MRQCTGATHAPSSSPVLSHLDPKAEQEGGEKGGKDEYRMQTALQAGEGCKL